MAPKVPVAFDLTCGAAMLRGQQTTPSQSILSFRVRVQVRAVLNGGGGRGQTAHQPAHHLHPLEGEKGSHFQATA